MISACEFRAPNGEPSVLYRQLAARFGDETAAFVYSYIHTDEFQNTHGRWTDRVIVPEESGMSALPASEKIDISSSTKKSPYFKKDQVKFAKANKLIARGSANSSSEAYRIAVGSKANTGVYVASDIVAVSAEGKRTGRVKPDYAELEKAVNAGVTFITDNTADRNRSYNVGEREVADYLMSKGYTEDGDGVWYKEGQERPDLNAITTTTSDSLTIPSNLPAALHPLYAKKLVLNEDESMYVNAEGELFERISTLKGSITANIPAEAAQRGNVIDNLLRLFLSGKIEENQMAETGNNMIALQKYNIMFTDNFYRDLGKVFVELRQMIDARGLQVITDLPVVWGEIGGKKMAGALDILLYDGKGAFYIMDLKTATVSRRDSYEGKAGFPYKQYDEIQLNGYRELIRQRTGLDIKSLSILPITTKTAGRSETTGFTIFDTAVIDAGSGPSPLIKVNSNADIYELLGLSSAKLPIAPKPEVVEIRTNAQGEPTIGSILQKLPSLAAKQAVESFVVEVDLNDADDVLNPAHMHAPIVFEMDLLDGTATKTYISSVEQGVAVASLLYCTKMNVKQQAKFIELLTAPLVSAATVADIASRIKGRADFGKEQWDINEPVMYRIMTDSMVRALPSLHSYLTGAKGRFEVSAENTQFANMYANTLDTLRALYRGDNLEGSNTDLQLSISDLGKGVTILWGSVDEFGMSEQMSPSDFVEATESVRHAIIGYFRKNQSTQVSAEDITEHIKTSLRTLANSYSPGVYDPRRPNAEVTAEEAAQISTNLIRLFDKDVNGQVVLDVIIKYVLESAELKAIGISQLMQGDDMKIDENSRPRDWQDNVFSIASSRTATQRFKAILSSIPNMVTSSVRPRTIGFPISSASDKAALIKNQYPKVNWRGKDRRLLVRPKGGKLVTGEYAVIDVAVDKIKKRFLIQMVGVYADTIDGKEAILKAAETSHVKPEELEGAIIYEVIGEYSDTGIAKRQINKYGLPKSVDYNLLFTQIAEALAGKDLTDYNDILTNILYTHQNPNIRAAARAIDSLAYRTDAFGNRVLINPSIRNEFMSLMNQQENVMRRMLVDTTAKRTSDGETVYTNAVYVVDSNTTGAIDTLVSDWKVQQKFSDVASQSITGEITINRLKLTDLQMKVREMDMRLKEGAVETEEVLALIATVLNSHGINLNEFAIGKLYSDYGKYAPRDWNRKANAIFSFDKSGEPKGIISALVDTTRSNPFDHYAGVLRSLARLSLEFDKLAYARAYRNIENNLVYPHSVPDFLWETMKDIRSMRGTEYDWKDLHAADALHSENRMLTLPSNYARLQKMTVGTEDGLNLSKSTRPGKQKAKYSPYEQELQSLSLFLNQGRDSAIFASLTHSDKSRMPLFQIPFERSVETTWTLKDEQLELSDHGRNIIMNIIEMEYNRVRYGKTEGDKRWFLLPQLSIDGMKDMERRGVVPEGFHTRYYDESGRPLDGWISKTKNSSSGDVYNYVMEGETNVPIERDRTHLLYFLVIDDIVNQMVERQRNRWEASGLLVNNTWKTVDTKGQEAYSSMLRSQGMLQVRDFRQHAVLTNKAIAMDYVIHRFAFNAQVGTLLFGDPAQLYAKKFDGANAMETAANTMVEYGKRLAGPIAPARKPFVGAYESRKFRVLTIDDPMLTLDELGVESNGIADAQEWITTREWLSSLHATGEINTPIFREMMEIVEEGEKAGSYAFTKPEHLAIIRQPMKPVYYGVRKLEDGRVIRDYIKSSAIVLYPGSIGKGLNNLRLLMEAKGDPLSRIDRAHAKSARKMGNSIPLSFFDNSETQSKPVTREAVNAATTTLDRKYLGIQQYVPYDETETDISLVTQANKNILDMLEVLLEGDITLPYSTDSDGNPITLNKNSIRNYKEDIIKKLLQSQVNDLLESLSDSRGRITEENIRQRMYGMVEGLNYTSVQRASLLSKVGNQFSIPLIMNSNWNRYQSVLTNMVSKALKIEMPGHSWVQSSSAGMAEDSDSARTSGIVYVEGFDSSKRLRSSYKNGDKVTSAQILLPWNFRDGNGQLLDIMDYTKEVDGKRVIDNDKLPVQLRKIVGLRIPNQSHSSMLSLEVVGFLPQSEGSRAVVPADIARQMGSDFDVDKLYSYMYNYIATGGKLEVDNTTEEKVLQNKYIELFEVVLSNPSMYDKIMKSIDQSYIKDLQKKYVKASNAGNFFEGAFQDTDYHNQKNGKDLVGVFAKSKTFEPLTQQLPLTLSRHELNPLTDKVERQAVTLSLFKDVDGVTPITFTKIGGNGSYNIYDDSANVTATITKGDRISLFLSEAVDYSKNRAFDGMNVNLNTSPLLTALLYLQDDDGNIASYEQILSFLMQPVIVEFNKRLNDKSIFGVYTDERQVLDALYKELRDTQNKLPEHPSLEDVKPVDLQTLEVQAKLSWKQVVNKPALRDAQYNILNMAQALLEIGRGIQTIQSAMDADVNGVGKTLSDGYTYLQASSSQAREPRGFQIHFMHSELMFVRPGTPTHSNMLADGNPLDYGQAVYNDLTEKGAYNYMAHYLYNRIISRVVPMDNLFKSVSDIATILNVVPQPTEMQEWIDAVTVAYRGYNLAAALPNADLEQRRLTALNMQDRLRTLKNRYPTNAFLRNLAVVEQMFKNTNDPVFLRYGGSNITDLTDEGVYQHFVNGLTSNESRDLKDFVKDMVLVEMLLSHANSGTSMNRFIHPVLYERMGFGQALRNAVGRLNSHPASIDLTFVDNFVRHNPELTRKLSMKELNLASFVNDIDLMAIASNNPIMQARILGNGQGFPSYFHILHQGVVALYKRVSSDGKYTRIDVLGNKYMSEYGRTVSLIPANRRVGQSIFPIKPQVLGYHAKEMGVSEKLRHFGDAGTSSAVSLDTHILQGIANDTSEKDLTRNIAETLAKRPIPDVKGMSFSVSVGPHATSATMPFKYSNKEHALYWDDTKIKEFTEEKGVTQGETYVHESLHARLNYQLSISPGMQKRLFQIRDAIVQNIKDDPEITSDVERQEKLAIWTDDNNAFEWLPIAMSDPNAARQLGKYTFSGSGSVSPQTIYDKIMEFIADLYAMLFDSENISRDSVLYELRTLSALLLEGKDIVYTKESIVVNGETYNVFLNNGVPQQVAFASNKPWSNAGMTAVIRDNVRDTVIAEWTKRTAASLEGGAAYTRDGVGYPMKDVFGFENNGLYILPSGASLNEKQRVAVDEITTFMSNMLMYGSTKSLSEKSWMLAGPGGSGKTAILSKILAHIAAKHNLREDNFLFITPTHEARNNLGQALGKQGPVGKTIASVIGDRPVRSIIEGGIFKDEFEVTRQGNDVPAVVVIDEASMINIKQEAYLNDIIDQAQVVLFVGDWLQLKGVIQENAKFRMPDGRMHTVTKEEADMLSWPVRTLMTSKQASLLQQNMRTGSEDIALFVNQSRVEAQRRTVEQLSGNAVTRLPLSPTVTNVFNSENLSFVTTAEELINNKYGTGFLDGGRFDAEDPYNQVIIAYRTGASTGAADTVGAYNALVRRKLFGPNADKYTRIPGDHLRQAGSILMPADEASRDLIGNGFTGFRFKLNSVTGGNDVRVRSYAATEERPELVFPNMIVGEIAIPPKYQRPGLDKTARISEFPVEAQMLFMALSEYSTFGKTSMPKIVPLNNSWWEAFFIANGYQVLDGKLITSDLNEDQKYVLREDITQVLDYLKNTKIEHAYATNVHKTQAAGFKYVYADEQDLLQVMANRPADRNNADLARARYTMFSRAMSGLTVMHADYKVSGFKLTQTIAAQATEKLGKGIPNNPKTEGEQNLWDDLMQNDSSFTGLTNKTGARVKVIKDEPVDRLVDLLIDQRRDLMNKIKSVKIGSYSPAVESYWMDVRNLNQHISRIKSTKDITQAYELSKNQLDWVESQLDAKWFRNDDGVLVPLLKHADMIAMHSMTKLWSNFSKLILNGVENGNQLITNPDMVDIQGRAALLHERVINTINEMITETQLPLNGASTDMKSLMQDLGMESANNYILPLVNSGRPMFSRAANIINTQLIQRNQEIKAYKKEIEALLKEATLLGGTMEQGIAMLWDKLTRRPIETPDGKTVRAWGLLSQYSSSYGDSLRMAYAKMNRAIDVAEKNALSEGQLRQNVNDAMLRFIEERLNMEIFVNADALFDDNGIDKIGKEAQAEFDRINEETNGDAAEVVRKAREKFRKFLQAKEAIAMKLQEDRAAGIISMQTEQEQLDDWTQLHDPRRFSQINTGDLLTKDILGAFRFMGTAPRAKINGQDSGFYDADYAALMAATDEQTVRVRDWYNKYKAILNKMKELYPEVDQGRMSDGFLPTVNAKQLQRYSNAIDYMNDTTERIKNNFTAPEWEEALTYGDVIPKRFIGSGRSTMDEEEYNKYSHDLVRMLEMFVGSSIHQKHMNSIFDTLKLFDVMFKDANEVKRINNLDEIESTMKAWEYLVNKTVFQMPQALQGGIGNSFRFTPLDAISKDKKKYAELAEELNDVKLAISSNITKLQSQQIGVLEWLSENQRLLKEEEDLKTEMAVIEAKYPSRKLYASKVADTLIRVQQLKSFSYNPISALVNLTMGYMSAFMYAAGNQEIKEKTFDQAFYEVNKAFITRNTALLDKLSNFMEEGDLMGELRETWHGQTNLKAYGKWYDKLDPFVFMRHGDKNVRMAVVMAYLKDTKVTVGDKELPLFEVLDSEGQWNEAVYGKRVGWGTKGDDSEAEDAYSEMATHMAALQRIMESIVGVVDQRTPLLAKKGALGRLIGQFRLSWIPSGFDARWGAERFDERLQRTVKGRYRTSLDLSFKDNALFFFRQFMNKTFRRNMENEALFDGINLKSSKESILDSDLDMANMLRNYRGMVYLMRVGAMMFILNWLLDDEDDEYKKRMMMFTVNMLYRNYQDLTFFTNPLTMSELTRGVVPSVNVVTDFVKFADALVIDYVGKDLIMGSDEMDMERLYMRFARSGIVPQLEFTAKMYNTFTKEYANYANR